MPKSLSISSTNSGFPDYLDFQKFREIGLAHIAKFSGKIWTDHNLHDPGITLLELLCYAVTDLGYRNNLDIKDLLAYDKVNGEIENNFFTAAQILGNNPLTILDYRKLLIDIKGVRNAWLEPAKEAEVSLYVNCDKNELQYDRIKEKQLVLNGLYKVLLELDSIRPQDKVTGPCGEDQVPVGDILKEVNNRLHQHRNFCEDFLEINVLKDESIAICGDIELDANADPEEALAGMFERIQEFLSPTLTYYSLQDMLDKGKTMEEIYSGRPRLLNGTGEIDSHGFVDEEELKKLTRRTEIHASDIYQEILKDKNIRAIKELYLLNYINDVPQTTGEEWCLKLTDMYRPVLSTEHSTINFFKGPIPFNADKKKVKELFEKKLSNFQKTKLPQIRLDRAVPEGEYRDLDSYLSVQHELPLVYGIGEGGLPEEAPTERRAQARQLKGYLMFYDQLLADYLSQLAHFRDFFSFVKKENPKEERTYFVQRVDSVPDVELLVRYYDGKEGVEPTAFGSEAQATYGEGEVLAISSVQYATPGDRDETIRRLKDGFAYRTLDFDAAPVEEDSPDFKYIIKFEGEHLLESQVTFTSKEEAVREAQSLYLLGVREESYRPVNQHDNDTHHYGFELLYNPIGYLSYLEHISENEETFFDRRNRFLDHLLSRFSEQFTDYVLLMFALNGKRNDPQRVIEDKMDFLAAYPDISQNRGKGFQYKGERLAEIDTVEDTTTTAVVEMSLEEYCNALEASETDGTQQDEKICADYEPAPCNQEVANGSNVISVCENNWSTDNVSGLEKRVSRLMGLKDFSRDSLANFHVATKGRLYHYQHKDFRGQVIFESKEGYPTQDAAQLAYLTFRKFATNKKLYEKLDCCSDSVFGFQIMREETERLLHQLHYSTAEERDAIIDCIIKLASKKALVAKINQTQVQAFHLQVCYNTSQLLFELPVVFKSPQDAKDAFDKIIYYLSQSETYQKIDRPDCRQYSFDIQVTIEKVEAIHPDTYGSAELRDDRMACICKMMQTRDGVICEAKSTGKGYYYYFYDDGGKQLLRSADGYASELEAWEAWFIFIELAKNKANYQEVNDEFGLGYGFNIVDSTVADTPVIVAQHPEMYLDPDDRKYWLDYTFSLISNKELNYAISQAAPHYTWRLRDIACEPLLVSLHQFKEQEQAAAAYLTMLDIASDPDNYVAVLNENTGKWILQLKKKSEYQTMGADCTLDTSLIETPIAQYPEGVAEEEIEATKTRIVDYVVNSGFPKEQIIACPNAFYAIIQDAQARPLLESKHLYFDLEAAQNGYQQLLEIANEDTIIIRQEEGYCKYYVECCDENGNLVAKAPNPFENGADAVLFRDQLLHLLSLGQTYFGHRLIFDCFSFQLKGENGALLFKSAYAYQATETAFAAYHRVLQLLLDPDNVKLTANATGHLFGFEIMDKEDNLWAFHPNKLETISKRNEKVEGLRCGVVEDTLPAWLVYHEGAYYYHFQNKDRINILNGLTPFKTRVEAQIAFFEIHDLACEEENYEKTTDEGGCLFSFKLNGDSGETLASHPVQYLDAGERDEVLNGFRTYSCKNKYHYSIEEASGDYHFEIFWPDCSGMCQLLFVGTRNYTEAELAERACDNMVEALLSDSETGTSVAIYGEHTIKDTYTFVVRDEDGLVIAKTPLQYETPEERDRAIEQVLNYLKGGPDFDPIRRPKKIDANNNLILAYTINLEENGTRVAKHPANFETKSARTQKLIELVEDLVDFEEAYGINLQTLGTVPDSTDGNSIKYPIEKRNDGYQFCLRKGGATGPVEWMSEKEFSTPTDAVFRLRDILEGLTSGTVKVVKNIAEEKNYSFHVRHKNKVLVQHPNYYADTDERDERMNWLWIKLTNPYAYYGLAESEKGGLTWGIDSCPDPIIEEEDGFTFCLVDKAKPEDIEWLGTERFGTIVEAEAHLVKLLQQLEENEMQVQRVDKKDYVVNLGDGLLTSGFYENEDSAWEGLDFFLSSLNNDQALCYDFIDYHDDCKYGFQWVAGDFFVACHTQYYHTPEEREQQRDELYRYACCVPELYTEAEYITKKEGDQYFFRLEDCHNFDPVGSLWDSAGMYLFQEDVDCAAQSQYIDILEYARERSFYHFAQRIEGQESYYVIELLNQDGVVIAVNDNLPLKTGFPTLEDAHQRALELRLFARLYPIIRVEGGYTFQLYRANEESEEWNGDWDWEERIIWKGKQVYSCVADAMDAFRPKSEKNLVNFSETGLQLLEEEETEESVGHTFIELLCNKQSYHRNDGPDCGPYSLYIVNPGSVLFNPPESFEIKAELDKQKAKVDQMINAEGFHVIEHILLRPKVAAVSSYSYQLKVKGEPVLLGTDKFNTSPKKGSQKEKHFLEILQQIGAKWDGQFNCGQTDSAILELVEAGESYADDIISLKTFCRKDWEEVLFSLTDYFSSEPKSSLAFQMISEVEDTVTGGMRYELQVVLDDVPVLETTFGYPNPPTDEDIEALKDLIRSLFCNWPDEIELGEQFTTGNDTDTDFTFEITGETGLTGGDTGFLDDETGTFSYYLHIGEGDNHVVIELLDFDSLQEFKAKVSKIYRVLVLEETQLEVGLYAHHEGIRSDALMPISVDPELCEEAIIGPGIEDIFGNYLPESDPYSCWASVVIPYWPKRFQNTNFREFFNNTLRREVPAHVALRICWVDARQLLDFEEKYQRWLNVICRDEDCDRQSAQDDLVACLFNLVNIYPLAKLIDCGGNNDGNAVVLNHTKLG